MINIVILDGHTTNSGDLSWNSIAKLGNITVYDRTREDQVLERSLEADIVLTNKTLLPAHILRCLPRLKMISVLATGFNVVDTSAAKELGIVVCNVPAYSTISVAQNVFALLLEITNETARYSESVHSGEWTASPDFSYTKGNLIELAGKKMGIIGFGNIGGKVAEIASAFGMETHAFSSKPQEALGTAIKTDLDDIFRICDVISLHCPLTDRTEKLVNRERIELMKQSAILINTGRGPLVDEKALADALNTGRIYAAGVDVLSCEPPKADNPLLSARNCFITPHISWATKEARTRLLDITIENINAFLKGTPVNVVN